MLSFFRLKGQYAFDIILFFSSKEETSLQITTFFLLLIGR